MDRTGRASVVRRSLMILARRKQWTNCGLRQLPKGKASPVYLTDAVQMLEPGGTCVQKGEEDAANARATSAQVQASIGASGGISTQDQMDPVCGHQAGRAALPPSRPEIPAPKVDNHLLIASVPGPHSRDRRTSQADRARSPPLLALSGPSTMVCTMSGIKTRPNWLWGSDIGSRG